MKEPQENTSQIGLFGRRPTEMSQRTFVKISCAVLPKTRSNLTIYYTAEARVQVAKGMQRCM